MYKVSRFSQCEPDFEFLTVVQTASQAHCLKRPFRHRSLFLFLLLYIYTIQQQHTDKTSVLL